MTRTRYEPARKVMTPDAVKAWRLTQPGRVVFTNGVFDLLHPGHIDVLRHARAEGDALIVALNTDASVRRLGKGSDRPIRRLEDRALVVAALEMVDVVTWFEDETPLALIQHLRPDVLVKGGDYQPDTIVGAADVRRWGGSVVVVPLVPGQSTTAIVTQLRESNSSS